MEFVDIQKVRETQRLTMELRCKRWDVDLGEVDARRYAEMADRQLLDGYGGYWSVHDVYRNPRDGSVVCVEFELPEGHTA